MLSPGKLRSVGDLDADYFDGWYADKLGADVLEKAKRRHLGHPPELIGTSLLTLSGLQEVAAALRLTPAQRLLDLACGGGGFGSWVARVTGCGVVGVDFSTVAVEHAREAAGPMFGLDADHAEFIVGGLTETGLPDSSVDAVMVIDSMQFAPGLAVAAECRRVLRPGGRIAVTGWEPVDRADPVHSDRIRSCDLGESLRAAGFAAVDVVERPEWLAAERAFWEEVVTHDPDEHPALPSAVAEGRRTLTNWGKLRRLLATAVHH
jgi:SAM-dependent methyltransferase